jgi:hypothetical protein
LANHPHKTSILPVLELDDYHENVGEYNGSGIHDGKPIIYLTDSWGVALTTSAARVIHRLKIGDRVGILRIGDTIRVRIIPSAKHCKSTEAEGRL